jgi:hypothetical protein
MRFVMSSQIGVAARRTAPGLPEECKRCERPTSKKFERRAILFK